MRLTLALLVLTSLRAVQAADLDFGLTGITPVETARLSATFDPGTGGSFDLTQNPPDPVGGENHFGSSGLTGLDTSRLNVFCPAGDATRTTEPCDVTFIFHDTRGRVLKQATRTLDPDTAAFLDFRAAEAGMTVRRREIISRRP